MNALGIILNVMINNKGDRLKCYINTIIALDL